jgi:hypothetical protein
LVGFSLSPSVSTLVAGGPCAAGGEDFPGVTMTPITPGNPQGRWMALEYAIVSVSYLTESTLWHGTARSFDHQAAHDRIASMLSGYNDAIQGDTVDDRTK